jgi:hypothetical protein
MPLPDALAFELARAIRSEARDFHFNELVRDGFPVGVFVLTPDQPLSISLRRAITQIVKDHQLLRSDVRFFSQGDFDAAS